MPVIVVKGFCKKRKGLAFKVGSTQNFIHALYYSRFFAASKEKISSQQLSVTMALLEKQLFVKESTIPGAGKGLFTKVDIAKGTRVVEYKGRRTVWKEVKNDSD